MWPFSLFRKPKPPAILVKPPSGSSAVAIEELFSGLDRNDYLGEAARLEEEAKDAIREKRYDVAWMLQHRTKEMYGKHAVRYGMNRLQTIALDASVHETLANIRRLEGNFDDALVHLIYTVASSPRMGKAQEKKIQTYFARCSFKRTSMDDLYRFQKSAPDFRAIENKVSEWRSGEVG